MSAIPLEDAMKARVRRRSSKRPAKARAYFLRRRRRAVMAAPFLAELDQTGHWIQFALLAASVALAQFFVVRTPGNKAYHTTGVFLIAAVLLLSPGLSR